MGALIGHSWCTAAKPTQAEQAQMGHHYRSMLADPRYRLREYEKRLMACRRALGIVNRLPPGPYKAKHASRVLGRMNRCRALVAEGERSVAFLDRVLAEFNIGGRTR